MNLFNLDENIELCAEYHIDKHTSKMQLEAAQMICTNMWIDRVIGYVPRKINSEEIKELKKVMSLERPKAMEDREIPYLVAHYNHPSTVWMRESLSNYDWSLSYIRALSKEHAFRGGNPKHKSLTVVESLSDPRNMKDVGKTRFKLAISDKMPKELVDENRPIWSYRNFYMLDKAAFSSWKVRGKPHWWDESIARYDKRISS